MPGRDEALRLDEADPLAAFRERFVIPDPYLVYLDGTSLGRLPRSTAERLERVAAQWGERLIRGWYEEWLGLPVRVGDLVGGLVGAAPGQVAVADSTTVCLYKLASAALDLDPSRTEIVVQRDEFPTDRYVLEGLAAARGLELRWFEGDPVEGPSAAEIGELLGARTALVVLSHVNYRSAAIAPVPEITRLVHDAGALVLWDLCHSAGVLPVGLDEADVDLAVGCTYKYLNGGPGSPAFIYVAERLQPRIQQPIWGWFGRRDQFLMEQGYEPAPGISSWLSGTPGVLGLASVDEGAKLTAEAGLEAIRAKARDITEYAIALHDERLAPLGFTLGSPRDPDRRGSHVSVRRSDVSELCAALTEAGVLTDFRMPDTIRLGCSPLTTSYVEVWDGVDRLVTLSATAAPPAANPRS
jgi:kynureninase